MSLARPPACTVHAHTHTLALRAARTHPPTHPPARLCVPPSTLLLQIKAFYSFVQDWKRREEEEMVRNGQLPQSQLEAIAKDAANLAVSLGLVPLCLDPWAVGTAGSAAMGQGAAASTSRRPLPAWCGRLGGAARAPCHLTRFAPPARLQVNAALRRRQLYGDSFLSSNGAWQQTSGGVVLPS